MSTSNGVYRIAQIIKWGGRGLGIVNLIGTIIFMLKNFWSLMDFLAICLGFFVNNSLLICKPESKYLVFITVLLFLITVIVWLLAEGIAWVLEGFAK